MMMVVVGGGWLGSYVRVCMSIERDGGKVRTPTETDCMFTHRNLNKVQQKCTRLFVQIKTLRRFTHTYMHSHIDTYTVVLNMFLSMSIIYTCNKW